MPTYTQWTWSAPHNNHYCYMLSDSGEILKTYWGGPAQASSSASPPASSSGPSSQQPRGKPNRRQPSQHPKARTHSSSSGVAHHHAIDNQDDDESGGKTVEQADEEESDDDDEEEEGDGAAVATRGRNDSGTIPNPNGPQSFQARIAAENNSYDKYPGARNKSTVSSLPKEIQAQIEYLERRYLRTSTEANVDETLDSRFRRVVKHHHAAFFVPGRVFKMLWTEPAGQLNPGKTRNSTHFSIVWLGEKAFSEIRYFVVVRNKGTFSQCIPIQTYGKKGATKPGLVMKDHGIIHTTLTPPVPLVGEHLTKYSLRVEANYGEELDPHSRINYGKAYAVEHNVKVLDIGMVTEGHRYMIKNYFDEAMQA